MKTMAEIAANHQGSMDLAKKMIDVAASYCGVSAVKFQKRTVSEMLTDEEYAKPYENPNSFGKTYGEHRDALEFDVDQHKELAQYCFDKKVKYGCSVWDMTAAQEIVGQIDPPIVKIASACNTNKEMIEWIFGNSTGEIHISMGMTTQQEKATIRGWLLKQDPNRIVVYHCVSAYPTPFEKAHLLDIDNYKQWAAKLGFSGHHLGISTDIGAAVKGCEWFERHFTLDRSMKGADQSLSLEPDGMKKLVRDLNNIQKSLKKSDGGLLDIEEAFRKKLKRVI